VGLRPAEFHEKARGRRLKAGGSQDWLPHFLDGRGSATKADEKHLRALACFQ
jgi:hypothetical protein